MNSLSRIIKEGKHYAVCEYSDEYGLLAMSKNYSTKVRSYPKTIDGKEKALNDLAYQEEFFILIGKNLL